MTYIRGADVKKGQVWRQDTCDPPLREFDYGIDRIDGEVVSLIPLNGGELTEVNLGALLAYWVPVSL